MSHSSAAGQVAWPGVLTAKVYDHTATGALTATGAHATTGARSITGAHATTRTHATTAARSITGGPDLTTEVPDLLHIDVPVGARVVVSSDLRLTATPTPSQTATVTELSQAIDAWSGPGVLVFNGNLLAGTAQVPQVLGAHSRLVDAVVAFSAGPGRRVVILPGDQDGALVWSGPIRHEVAKTLSAETALSLELVVGTGAGERRVRVEPGHRLDPLAAFDDPRNSCDSPLAQHLREQVVPSVMARSRTGATGWLAGMDRLADPATFPRFVASRLAYRRLARWAWLLVIPVALAFVLRLPAFALNHRGALADANARLGLLVLATVIEVALLGLLAVASVRGTWRALAGVSVGGDQRDPNDASRSLARELVTAGGAGLITGHTCRPELAHLGSGFYANTGSGAEVVAEVDSRFPGLGLPSVFLAHRQIGWIELEAGHDLHVRLLYGRQDLAGASVLERLVARRGPDDSPTPELRPQVVATFPQGNSWPPSPTGETDRRRVRRVAATFVGVAGFVSLVSSLAAPWRNRLADIRTVVPLIVPETAASLTALLAVSLLMLARGIRRGQRRAWVVCEVVLLVVAVLHLVKGEDYEEAAVALAVAAFLFISRSAFTAAADVPRLRNGIGQVAAGVVSTIVAGTLGLKLSELVTRHALTKHRFTLSWTHAFQATVERMVGVTDVALPDRLDDFFTAVMLTATVGLLLAALAVVFRPVVARRLRDEPPAGVGTDGTGLARARAIMGRHGSGTLDYFALRPDKQFFFWGDTVVAHAVYSSVCLVSPDPIGPVAEREEAWRAFRAYVDDHGWALGGLGAGEEWLPIYRATGMHDLYVGDEAVVRVQRFTMNGGRFKSLRQAVNRVAKYGYTISFHDPAHLDDELKAALEEVMTKSRRGDVERGFSMTLGRVFDPADEGLLLAVVHGPPSAEGRPIPVAFCHYVPAPGIGGYSLDLMRRDDGDHPNGLIDFAVVETIRYLKEQGRDGLGLNFATMRAVLAGEAGEGMAQRIQAWLLRRMGDSMQIESLWKFNAKFDPEWLPRYAVYDAPENALATAIAVARAESFWELPVIGRFLVPSAEKPDEPAAPQRVSAEAAAPA